MKAEAPATDDRISAPWLSPTLLPENPIVTGWGILLGGKVEPMSRDELLALVRQGPGAERWNGQTERKPVILVATPGADRIVPLAECVEFQPLIIELDGNTFRLDRSKNGRLFYFLMAACVAMLVLDQGQAAFLPAIYASNAGTAHFEAWMALRKLKRQPAEYLKNLAAQIRYAYWQQSGGEWATWRTLGMAGVWFLIFIVQIYVSFTASGHAPQADIQAAALIKQLVPAQPWRLLTGPMLHGSVMHVLMNVVAMLSLGSILERCAHRNLVAPVWLLGALGGSLLSWIVLPADSVGASGGIMGLFGFLLIMVWRRRALMPPDFLASLLRSLLAMAMLGILAWTLIDNAAHLGGLVVGALVAFYIFREREGSLPLPDTTLLRFIGIASEMIFAGMAFLTLLKLID